MRVIAVLGALWIGIMSSASAGKTMIFHNPKISGYPLDACVSSFGGCDKVAANAFCRKHKFAEAKRFEVVRHNGKTKMLESGRLCTSRCQKFQYIICKKSSFFTYNYPTFKGVPLDWCLHSGFGCGKAVANAYCISRGHTKGAKDFKIRKEVGRTIAMGSGKVCTGSDCDGFTFIRCEK